MIVIQIEDWMREEAQEYAVRAHDYTARGHDFHNGGADEAAKYMYYGKLGEKAFKKFLIDNNIQFLEDETGPDQADEYDFLVNGYRIDVKTRTRPFHTKTLEMVKQFHERPKDIYVGAYYNEDNDEVCLYGYIWAEKLSTLHEPKSMGYIKNYWANDNEMSQIENLIVELNN